VLDEIAVYVVMIASGLPVVAAALIRGDRLEGGTTLCLVSIALGVLGLVHLAARRMHLPRAREVRPGGRRVTRAERP
jgi:hypothetical protein